MYTCTCICTLQINSPFTPEGSNVSLNYLHGNTQLLVSCTVYSRGMPIFVIFVVNLQVTKFSTHKFYDWLRNYISYPSPGRLSL